MEKPYEKKITWTIKNFSSLQCEKLCSDNFLVGSSKWHLRAYPKGDRDKLNKSLSLYLAVSDSESLPRGWKIHAKFCLTVVNQVQQFLSQQTEAQSWFSHEKPNLGYEDMLPLCRLLAKNSGFLVNEEVKIVAKVSVLEFTGKTDVMEETLLLNESVNVNGFQFLPSQVESVNNLFLKHPNIASKLSPKNPQLRTAYLNSVLSLTEILNQSPKALSIDDLINAYSTLTCVTKSGFNVDWLLWKLKEVGKNRMGEIELELKDLKQKSSHMEVFLEFLQNRLMT